MNDCKFHWQEEKPNEPSIIDVKPEVPGRNKRPNRKRRNTRTGSNPAPQYMVENYVRII